MSPHAAAALYVVAAWWISTGLVLRLVWLGRSTHRWSLALASGLSLVGLGGVAWAAWHPTPLAAYVGFACALLVWGWHELTFLLGIITGPRRAPCPPDARGWERFRLATATLIHHEVLLALSALGIVILTWGAPNQVATHTFLVLWAMRLSAKLNVFLGVRSFNDELVPERLRYLLGYFTRDRLSPLMPASFVLGGGLAGLGFLEAFGAEATPFVATGQTMVASLLLLGLLEHVFLTLPLPDASLWRWATNDSSSRSRNEEASDAPARPAVRPLGPSFPGKLQEDGR
ncbi:MAG: putative photosynthetic complex assembly protein PuhE [Myxococcota bacterium]